MATSFVSWVLCVIGLMDLIVSNRVTCRSLPYTSLMVHMILYLTKLVHMILYLTKLTLTGFIQVV